MIAAPLADSGPATSPLNSDTMAIEAWLVDAGIESLPGLAAVLADLAGSGGVSQLSKIKEAELLLRVGKLGLRGVKLRKLLASLHATAQAGNASTSEGPASTATGGGAFEYLVSKDGPLPVFTPRSQSSTVAAAAAVAAADLTPPVFTPRSTPGATVADRDGPNAIATSPAADPPLTPRLMPEATITPRTMERARMATLTLEEDERVAIALQEEEDKELRDEQLALQLQHVEDEGRSEELAKETLSVAKERATKGRPTLPARDGGAWRADDDAWVG